MEKWTSLNMELRSFVISRVLRLEQTSSSLMKTILRLFKDDLKTLGNKSSALSFKSKIDLLYDLEENLPREEKLKITFNKLFEIVCGRLLTIEMEYLDGVQEEYKSHINNKALENLDEIWESAYQMNLEKTAEKGLAIIPTSFQDDLEFFKLAFNVKLSEFTLSELEKTTNNKKEVFRKKLPVEEKLRRLKEEEE